MKSSVTSVIILAILSGILVLSLNCGSLDALDLQKGALYSKSINPKTIAPDLAFDISKPWITISKNGRYLAFEDGRSFIPLGVSMEGDHINMDYYGKVTLNGQEHHYPNDGMEKLFQSMKRYGENILRIDIEGTGRNTRSDLSVMISEGKVVFLEDPVGTFNPDHIARIDRLIALAEKYDIYLGLVMIAHTCALEGGGDLLDFYPYHVSRGGPLSELNDLLVKPDVYPIWKRRLEFISSRWGGSDRIAYWELYNELLNCGGNSPGAAAFWVSTMGQHLKNFELQQYGKAHPVLVSNEALEPDENFFYESPGTDFMLTHYYGQNNGRGNPVLAALEVREGVLNNLAQIGFSVPFLENERTLASRHPLAVQQETERAVAWAYMASGAAGPGSTWVRNDAAFRWRTKEVVEDTHKVMNAALRHIDFSNFNSLPIDVAANRPDITSMVIADKRQALGWILHNNWVDYSVENVRTWVLSDKFQYNPMKDLAALYQISDNQAAKEAIGRSLVRLIADVFSLPEDEVIDAVYSFLSGDSTFKDLIRKLPRRPDRSEIRAFILALKNELKQVEVEHGFLKALYKGHPEISATLTFPHYFDSRRTVIWIDDVSGKEIGRETIAQGRIKINTPVFSKSVAFFIR